MKRWRIYFRNTLGVPSPTDSFLEIEGDLYIEGGVLVFFAPSGDIFRVIKDYSDCFATNAVGEPLRPA